MKLIETKHEDGLHGVVEEVNTVFEGALEECKKRLRDIVDFFDYKSDAISEVTSSDWNALLDFSITFVNKSSVVIQKFKIE